MNTSMLENKEYIDAMNQLIEKSLDINQYKNACDRWHILKSEATELTQHYSKRFASERKKKRDMLTARLKMLKKVSKKA